MIMRVPVRSSADRRHFYWLGSTLFHAIIAALLLSRTPFGLSDRRDISIATAPNIELGIVPAPAIEQSPHPEIIDPQEETPTSDAEKPPEPTATTESAPPAQPEPVAPAVSEPLPSKADVPQESAAIVESTPPVHREPITPAVPEPLPSSEAPELPQAPEPSTPPIEKPVVAKQSPKPQPKPTATAKKARQATRSQSTNPAGTMSGAQTNHAQTGASHAHYGALVRAEIMRRRTYPADAASRGEQGTVVVRVTIGPGGTAVSHAIVRGSGIASFDQAVPRIMSRLSLPPPPGGNYTATVAIRFALD